MNKTHTELNAAFSSYFFRVATLSGSAKLPCTITYLAGHKFFGSEPFINTIVNGGDLPEKFLANTVRMIDSELKVDFTDEEATAFGVHERSLAFTFSELFYINALSTYLGVNNDQILELLTILTFTHVLVARPATAKCTNMSDGIVKMPKELTRGLSLYDIIEGTYVDIHSAIDQGVAEAG